MYVSSLKYEMPVFHFPNIYCISPQKITICDGQRESCDNSTEHITELGLVKMWDTCILVSVKINSHLDKCFMIVQSFDSVLTLLAVSVQWHCGQSWYNKVRHKWHYMESVRLHGRWVARYNKMVIQQFNRDESWEQWRGAG